MQERIDSSSQADQENVDCLLRGWYNQPGSSSSHNSFPSLRNVVYDVDDEDQILQQNQSTNERHESVTDFLNKQKDSKLAKKKTGPDNDSWMMGKKTSS